MGCNADVNDDNAMDNDISDDGDDSHNAMGDEFDH